MADRPLEPAFELRDVVKRYDGHAALGPISAALPERRTTVVIGPSGCGKSTLLRLLLGLTLPDAGAVLAAGAPVTPSAALELRRRLGYVVQDGGLFPHLTAAGNVALVATQLGWEPARARTRVAELCDLTRFPREALIRYPAELSGGQRQRVGLMRALMLDPRALLLDEPLGALDPLVRAELQDDLKAIFRELGKTVVLVTHDMGEAAHFADGILLLREGRVVQEGSAADLWHRPADPFVTRFIQAQRGLAQALGEA